MKTQGIYAIVNVTSGGRYVGSSVDITARFHVHRWELRRGVHTSRHLQNAWNKYREDAFVLVVLELVEDRAALIVREQWHIDQTENLYNAAPFAGRPAHRSGFTLTPEHREKIAAAQRGRPKAPSVAAANRGKKITDTHRSNLREGQARRWARPDAREAHARIMREFYS